MQGEADFESNEGGVEAGAVAGKGVTGGLTAVYKFLRPHTIRGTILASVTGVARALVEVPLAGTPWLSLLPNAVKGMLALLFGNAFIVGINQIFDVDIDTVNKPFLPVAAGELSMRRAWCLVVAGAIAGPLLVHQTFSPVIFKLYMFGTTLGCMYSVPPFRFKQNPILAGLTIALVRGFLLNFGVYYAAREALGLSFVWNPAVAFLARFMTVFAATIAVTKDLPDIDGDALFGIKTFSTELGVAKIAKLATAVLGLNYVSAMAIAAFSPAGMYRAWFMGPAHGAALVYLLRAYSKLNPDSKGSVKGFYKRIWDLFYAEYLIYPFI